MKKEALRAEFLRLETYHQAEESERRPYVAVIGMFQATRWNVAADFRRHYDACPFTRALACPGIPELLSRLKASGRNLHIATNKCEAPTRRLLECKGVLGLFSVLTCVDRVPEKLGRDAPDPGTGGRFP